MWFLFCCQYLMMYTVEYPLQSIHHSSLFFQVLQTEGDMEMRGKIMGRAVAQTKMSWCLGWVTTHLRYTIVTVYLGAIMSEWCCSGQDWNITKYLFTEYIYYLCSELMMLTRGCFVLRDQLNIIIIIIIIIFGFSYRALVQRGNRINNFCDIHCRLCWACRLLSGVEKILYPCLIPYK